MKIIATAAAAALMSGSAMAADLSGLYGAPGAMTETSRDVSNIVGEVSLWVGAGFVDADEDNFNQDTVFNFGGDGRAAWNMDNGFGLQFELQGRGGFSYDEDEGDDDDDDDNNLAYVATAVHGFTRGDSYALGAYGSIYGGGQVENDDSTYYVGGAFEAATFLGNNTLFGQIGGGTLLNDGEGAENHYFGRAGWRYFYTDYTKLEIDGLIGGVTGTPGTISFPGGEPDGIYANWGVELEHQYMGTPLAAFIAYRGYYTDEDDPDESSDNMHEHVFKLGATLRFGGDARTVDHYMPFDAADQSQLLFWDEL